MSSMEILAVRIVWRFGNNRSRKFFAGVRTSERLKKKKFYEKLERKMVIENSV